jgi:uncharacterized MnhB-related membrane protein
MIADAWRGLVIGALALLLAWLPNVPNAPVASTPVLIGAGLALQLALIAVRRFVRRQESTHGVAGSWSPTMIHVGALLGDGLTVLLVAMAVFQGMLERMTTI